MVASAHGEQPRAPFLRRWVCDVCHFRTANAQEWGMHISSASHRKNVCNAVRVAVHSTSGFCAPASKSVVFKWLIDKYPNNFSQKPAREQALAVALLHLVIVESSVNHDTHRHYAIPTSKPEHPNRCDVCCAEISSHQDWVTHVSDEKHLDQVCIAVQRAVHTSGGSSKMVPKSHVCSAMKKSHPKFFSERFEREDGLLMATNRALVEVEMSSSGGVLFRVTGPLRFTPAAPKPTPTVKLPPMVPPHWYEELAEEKIAALPVESFKGEVRTYSSALAAEVAALALLNEPILGLDTNRSPSSETAEAQRPPTLLMLATKNEVHIFKLGGCGLTKSMIQVLSTPTVVKASVGVAEDMRSLQRISPFEPAGVFDIADVATHLGVTAAVRQMATVLFRIQISQEGATANSSSKYLTPDQARYLAAEAWLGHRIYSAVKGHGLIHNGRVGVERTRRTYERPNPHPELEQTEMCSKGDNCRRYDPVTCERHGCWYAHSKDELRCKDFVFGRCNDPECTLKHTVGAKVREDRAKRVFRGRGPSMGERPAFVKLNFVRELPSSELPAELEVHVARNRATAVASTGFGAPEAGKFLTDRYTRSDADSGEAAGATVLNPDGTDVFATRESACEFVRCALQLEHYQQLSDVRRYDMEEVVIIEKLGSKQLYAVKCEGLAEKRPSVLRGDRIIVRSNQSLREHHGFVHYVALDRVWVSFSAEMVREISPKVTWKVVFTIQETPYRRQLLALKDAKTLLSSEEHFAPPAETAHGDRLRLNEKQQLCVGRVLDTARDTGHLGLTLIHGPPGTGKTTTVVAALHLLYKKRARVLVCCPSNHAADLIIERLAELHLSTTGSGIDSTRMTRIYGLSMLAAEVPEKVQPYRAEPEDYLRKGINCDLVVTTIMTAGLLYSLGVDMKSSFEYIVVDEAGQATESELAVPLAFAAPSRGTHVVLAGDHKQLGPVLRSKVAVEHGFGQSTLERLMQHPAVDSHAIQLVENYRSHPEILNLYNTLTYNNTLVACAPQSNTCVASSMSDIFPDPTKPVVFRHIEGTEDRERDSPSWMNLDECNEVMVILKRIFRHSGTGISFDDVVVLTPYQKQCKKITAKIHYEFQNRKRPFVIEGYDARRPPIRVCSVEQFQGREAKFVILSCVRSKKTEFVQTDIKHSIGFLKQPKRLNVAISRAIAGLIVVGNAGMLQTDDGWAALVRLLTTGGKAVRDSKGQLTKTLGSWLKGAISAFKSAPSTSAEQPASGTESSLSLVYDVANLRTLNIQEIAELRTRYRSANDEEEAIASGEEADDEEIQQPDHAIDGDWGRKDE